MSPHRLCVSIWTGGACGESLWPSTRRPPVQMILLKHINHALTSLFHTGNPSSPSVSRGVTCLGKKRAAQGWSHRLCQRLGEHPYWNRASIEFASPSQETDEMSVWHKFLCKSSGDEGGEGKGIRVADTFFILKKLAGIAGSDSYGFTDKPVACLLIGPSGLPKGHKPPTGCFVDGLFWHTKTSPSLLHWSKTDDGCLTQDFTEPLRHFVWFQQAVLGQQVR